MKNKYGGLHKGLEFVKELELYLRDDLKVEYPYKTDPKYYKNPKKTVDEFLEKMGFELEAFNISTSFLRNLFYEFFSTNPASFDLDDIKISASFSGILFYYFSKKKDVILLKEKPKSDLTFAFENAKEEIRILEIFINEWANLNQDIKKALIKNPSCKVKILIANPANETLITRLREKSLGIKEFKISDKIKRNILEFAELKKEHDWGKNVELRVFDEIPATNLHVADEWCYLAWFWHGTNSWQGPYLRLDKKNYLRKWVDNHFDKLWKNRTTIPIDLNQVTSIEDIEGMINQMSSSTLSTHFNDIIGESLKSISGIYYLYYRSIGDKCILRRFVLKIYENGRVDLKIKAELDNKKLHGFVIRFGTLLYIFLKNNIRSNFDFGFLILKTKLQGGSDDFIEGIYCHPTISNEPIGRRILLEKKETVDFSSAKAIAYSKIETEKLIQDFASKKIQERIKSFLKLPQNNIIGKLDEFNNNVGSNLESLQFCRSAAYLMMIGEVKQAKRVLEEGNYKWGLSDEGKKFLLEQINKGGPLSKIKETIYSLIYKTI